MERNSPFNNKKAVLFSVLAVATALLYFYNAKAITAGVKDGLAVCANAVIPSLFPFMIFASFLVQSKLSDTLSRPFSAFTRRVLHLPVYTGAVFLLSLIGGYPVGARAIAQLCQEKRLSTKTAARMLCFCVNAGPAFLISAVGLKMLNNYKAGVVILISQTLASIIIGCILGLSYPKDDDSHAYEKADAVSPSLADSFVLAVTNAAKGIFNICAFVITFSAILALVKSLPFIKELYALSSNNWHAGAQAAFTGFFEVTLGCISAAKVSGTPAIILTSALCSFGGCSVICQTVSCFSGLSVRMTPYLISRGVHMVLSCLFAFGLTHLFPDTVTTFSFTQSPIMVHNLSGTPIAACALLLLCAALILFRKDKIFL